MRVLKISCSVLFVAALAQNAVAQAIEQPTQSSVNAEKAALASGKRAKGTESSAAAQLPTRVLINFQSAANTTRPAANVRAADREKPSQQIGALMNVHRVNPSAARPAAPGVVRKPAKNKATAKH